MIKVNNLYFYFPVRGKDKFLFYEKILDGISFHIEKKEFVSFIGPSGCGKTTLLNILGGIYKNFIGSVSVNTEKISFVFQHDSLLYWKDVISNVVFPYEIKGIKPDKKIIKKANYVLDLVGLKGKEKLFPDQLSGGMKKRVELARALITTPELLILDEPFASLDVITRERLNILVKKIWKHEETTIVLVTHSIEEACFLSQKIYILSNLPAKLISVKEIPDKYSNTIYENYLFSDNELKVLNSIRKQVKDEWYFSNSLNSSSDDIGNLDKKELDEFIEVESLNRNSDKNFDKNLRKKNIIFKKFSSKVFNLIFDKLLIPFELLIIVIFLEIIKKIFNIADFIFPYPHAIFKRFIITIINGNIFPHLGMTLFESFTGFLIAFFLSVILAFFISHSKFLMKLFMPFLIGANTIPSVALAPFLVMWFGFGIAPRIIISVIVIFFPMLINNISAIKQTNEKYLELIRFYKTNPVIRLLKIEFPASFPLIISGIKISITLSVIGAVVGEFVSGTIGLGALVRLSRANFDTELMFVALIWLILLGLFYYNFASLIDKIFNKVHK